MDRPRRSNVSRKASQEVLAKMGAQRVANTDKATRVAVNAWASVELGTLVGESYSSKTNQWMFEALKDKVLPDSVVGEPYTLESLKSLNMSLAEFVEHYRTRLGKRLTPSSLSAYLEGISRWISENWNTNIDVIRDKIFNNPRDGFIHVANKTAAKQQSEGVRLQPYNVLSDKDVEKIFDHECTQVSSPTGYNNRLIMVMGMLLGLRATALRKLNWPMFHEENGFDGRPVIRYQGIIGSTDGRTKHSHGGLSAAKTIPTSINIFDYNIGLGINPYKMILEHKELCSHTKNNHDFFLRANGTACTREKFLTSAVIGETHFARLLKRVFEEVQVRGIGPWPHPVLHSLRKTMITNLMRAKCTDSQITLRTGHSNIQSVRPYANIQGEAGVTQQANLLGTNSHNLPKAQLTRKAGSSSADLGQKDDSLSASKKRKVQDITQAVIESAAKSSKGNITINLNFNL